MRIRHRIPTIFNLSMVDMLCCALGCVILLWLGKLLEAKLQAQNAIDLAARAGETNTELTRTRKQLEDEQHRAKDLTVQLRKSRGDLDSTTHRADEAENERDRFHRDLDAARERITDLDKTIAGMRSRVTDLDKAMTALRRQLTDTDERLAKKTQERDALAKEMAATERRVLDLEKEVRERDDQAKTAARRADGLAESLTDREARLRKTQALADLVPALRDEAKGYRTKLATMEARVALLEKDITDRKKDLTNSSQSLKDLEGTKLALERQLALRTRALEDANRDVQLLRTDKKTLGDELVRVRAAADNRFAGISLTGRRVIFMVDMSGSMELVDEKTPAPEKWSGVRETVNKIMRSLTDLEKFQVIIFAEKTSFLLGNEGTWLTYDPRTSPEQVTRALAAIKPQGATNMYSAFEAAFRYRAQGLDTIYLLSDGLPNAGEGIDPDEAKKLKETELSEILGNYIRKTLKGSWNRSAAGGRPRVRINSIGFFYESPDVGAFLWALSRENDGSFVGMSKP
jgi:predicted  nucleic acid-binding Zn-ribbon protein